MPLLASQRLDPKAHADRVPAGYKGRLRDHVFTSLADLRRPSKAVDLKTWDGPYQPGAFDNFSFWLVRTNALPANPPDPPDGLILGAIRGESTWGPVGPCYLDTLDRLLRPYSVRGSVVVCDGTFGVARGDPRLDFFEGAIDSIL